VKRAYDLLWVRGLGLGISYVLIAPIVVYQRLLSPLLPPQCKYHPSCSQYGLDSLLTHGPFKGLALGTARVFRCNPWSGGGVDPVPSRGRWLPDIYTDGRPRTIDPLANSMSVSAPSPQINFPGA
jgi:putative membrane protein insertion efficiency factor